MGTIRPRPQSRPTLSSTLHTRQRDAEQQRRVEVRNDPPASLVRVASEENLSWEIGTAWLDTSGE